GILLAPEDKGEILMRLLELGVLARLIPQLGDIESLYRRDLYHFFTVDVHTIRGIYFLKRLAEGEFNGEFRLARKILADFSDDERKMLFLAILFHDAGKGGGSGGHSERGAGIAADAAKSLDLKNGEIELITYLVRNHLLLSNSSRTRDIYDAKVINEIAEVVRNREELDQLYLLTAADMSSVAPHGSTGWSRSLLDELYVNLLKKIEEGVNISEDTLAAIAEKRAEFVKFAAGRKDAAFSQGDIAGYFSTLPARYFLYADAGAIFEHFALLKRAEKEEVVVDVREISQDYYEIVLVAKDAAGLLYRVTGVFLLNALTIMEARIFSGSNGVILDVFRVRDISGNCLS
ncbi:MAG: HD domain-containing protein, partial [Deltaproteobacteria bacterium]|nr:HD domain-containing protein [Deltaproteobacteria bacterium]